MSCTGNWMLSVATTADEVAGALKGLVGQREITVIRHSARLAHSHQKSIATATLFVKVIITLNYETIFSPTSRRIDDSQTRE